MFAITSTPPLPDFNVAWRTEEEDRFRRSQASRSALKFLGARLAERMRRMNSAYGTWPRSMNHGAISVEACPEFDQSCASSTKVERFQPMLVRLRLPRFRQILGRRIRTDGPGQMFTNLAWNGPLCLWRVRRYTAEYCSLMFPESTLFKTK